MYMQSVRDIFLCSVSKIRMWCDALLAGVDELLVACLLFYIYAYARRMTLSIFDC